MYGLIMVPLDSSQFSETALPLAATLSNRTRADLHLVTVVPDRNAASQDWCDKYLASVQATVSESVTGSVTTTLLQGNPVDLLLEEARTCHADAVVIATHGRGALSRAWLGSVADGFTRQADRPVLLVRPREDDLSPDLVKHQVGTVLVPLDGSELSEAALAHAVEFGELFDAAYHLTRVLSYPVALASPYMPDTVQLNRELIDEGKHEAARYLERHAERLRRRGLQVTASVVVHAQPGRAILEEAVAVGCGTIAMATHGLTGIKRAILGSTADKVLRGAEIPLLLYRPSIQTPTQGASS